VRIRWWFFWFIAAAIAIYFAYSFWVSPLRNKGGEKAAATS